MLTGLWCGARWIWSNTDTLKKWVEILALIVAAYWTYNKFIRIDEPSLERRPSINGELAAKLHTNATPQYCEVTYIVTVKNLGLTSFDVGGIHIHAWRNELPKPAPDPTFLDMKGLEKGHQFIDLTPRTSTLLRHFEPQRETWQSFTWILDAKQEPGLYMFGVDAEDQHKRSLGIARSWTLDFCTKNAT
jgi:hypothetical protein